MNCDCQWSNIGAAAPPTVGKLWDLMSAGQVVQVKSINQKSGLNLAIVSDLQTNELVGYKIFNLNRSLLYQ